MLCYVMSYSHDYRKRVVAFIRGGSSQSEASRIFGISRKTIYTWLHSPDLSVSRRRPYRSKLDKAALAADVRKHPDAFLHERAERFGVTPQTVWYALRRLNVRKKNDTLR